MFDGATYISVCENEIVYARVVEKGTPRKLSVEINPVKHAHVESVLCSIESAIGTVDPGRDWKSKLISTGSDDASFNLGKKDSVTKSLKDQVPHMMAIHCVSHRLELGVIDAMKSMVNCLWISSLY